MAEEQKVIPPNVTVVGKSDLYLQHIISHLRNRNTRQSDFKEYVCVAGRLLAQHTISRLPSSCLTIETPLKQTQGTFLSIPNDVLLVPVLRAGKGLVSGFSVPFKELFSLPFKELSEEQSIKVGSINMARDEETLIPTEHDYDIPNHISDYKIFILEVVVATGGTVKATIDRLVEQGAKQENIHVICVLAGNPGLIHIYEYYKSVSVLVGDIDEQVNAHGFIVPGLGDAGDRQFGPKETL